MAANKIRIAPGTPIVWANTTDFSGTANGFTRTHQIDLTSVASTEAREGAKADLTALMAPEYGVVMGLEYAVAPAATGPIAQVGFSWSHSATAGTGNDAGAAGVDGDYKNGSESEWFAQLLDWFNMTLTADATTVIQFASLGILTPKRRYVSPIMYNTGGQALHSDAVEMLLALIPLIPEIE